jgi:hypothetical protein
MILLLAPPYKGAEARITPSAQGASLLRLVFGPHVSPHSWIG